MGSFRVVNVVARPGVGGDGRCMIRRLQLLFRFKGRQLGKLLTFVRKELRFAHERIAFGIACARRNYIKALVNLLERKEFPTFLFPLCLLLCACGDVASSLNKEGVADLEVRGKFSSGDENESMAEVVLWETGAGVGKEVSSMLGKTFRFSVQPFDLSLLRKKTVFRGKIQETFAASSGKTYLLHSVWPDGRSERIRLNNVNRLLRRDTLSMREGAVLGVGDFLPPFALYDQDGEILTTEYFDGSVTVLNFIFTRCSVAEMCPASTMKMKKLQELSEKTRIGFVKFLSISLDPEFDAPGILKQYAQAYNLQESSFRLGTADKPVIDDLTRQFGVLRKKDQALGVDHTMRTLIVNSRRQIIYQVPGKGWAVEDFLARLQEGTKG